MEEQAVVHSAAEVPSDRGEVEASPAVSPRAASLVEEEDVINLETLSEITCIVDVGIRRRPLAADVYPEELVVRCDDCQEDDTEEALVVEVVGPSVGRRFTGNVLAVYCTNDMRKVPTVHPIVTNLTPLCSSLWWREQLITELLDDGRTHFAQHQTDGVVRDPPAILHLTVLGARSKVPQGEGNLQAWIKGCSPVGGLLGKGWCQSLHNFIEHGRWHSHEVLEGPWIFITELHHETIVQPQLRSPANPVAHPDVPDHPPPPPSSSSVNEELMDLYHLVLMLLEQQDEVITVTGIHVHPLTSGAQLTNARQIALFIYLKSDVVRTRLGRGQSYLGRVQDAIERD